MNRVQTNGSGGNSKMHLIAAAIFGKLKDTFDNGYWFCLNCQRTTKLLKAEGEQATLFDDVSNRHCERCKSPRVEWHAPIGEVINPGEL